MAFDRREQNAQEEANTVIIRCIEKGLGTMGGSATAIQYIEAISGVSISDMPQHADSFVTALRHLFRFGSIVALNSIIAELTAATSENSAVLDQVRAFSVSLTEGVKSIESGIV